MSRSYWPWFWVSVFSLTSLVSFALFARVGIPGRLVVMLLGTLVLWTSWRSLRGMVLTISGGRVWADGRSYPVSDIARVTVVRGRSWWRAKGPRPFGVRLETRSGGIIDAHLWRVTAMSAEQLGHEIADVVATSR